MERRKEEVDLLGKKYGEVEQGPNLDWVLFKAFPVPPGWSVASTELLVMIPPGYPFTPPDNFYVPVGFRLASGATPGNYSEGTTQVGRQWGQFSFHIQAGDWQASPEVLDGHNLLTFMLQVEKRLREAS